MQLKTHNLFINWSIMKILGVDTATSYLALGIVTENKILSELRFDARQTHAQLLMPNINKILEEAGQKLKDLDGIAISIGPGSFTGLRIGLATVKGLCYASGKPLVAISSLDALTYLNRTVLYPLVPIMDAKKGEVYSAIYEVKENIIKRISKYWVTSVEKLVAKIPKEVIFLGPDLEIFKAELLELYKGKAHFIEGDSNLPSGTAVAFLGLEKLKKNDYENLDGIEPLYVRKSEEELRFGHG